MIRPVGWDDFKGILTGLPRGEEARTPEEIEGD